MFADDIDPARGAGDKFGITAVSGFKSLQELRPPFGFCWECIGGVDFIKRAGDGNAACHGEA